MAHDDAGAGLLQKGKTEARKRLVSELEGERSKCNEWYENARIDNSMGADGRDTRQTRKMRDRRAPTSLGIKADRDEESVEPPESLEGKLQVQVIQMELENSEVDQDLRSLGLMRYSKGGSKASKQPPQLECFYEHTVLADERSIGDRLRYNDKWFYRGAKVTIEWPGDAEKVTGLIFMFTPTHIWLRRTDGDKFSLPLSQLRKQLASLRAATGREQ